MAVNIHEFAKKFDEEYEYLYENNDRVAGFDEAVGEFDSYLESDYRGFKSFVAEFVGYRQDVISSDRECAAFMFALASMEG